MAVQAVPLRWSDLKLPQLQLDYVNHLENIDTFTSHNDNIHCDFYYDYKDYSSIFVT